METICLVPTMWAEVPSSGGAEALRDADRVVLEDIRAVLEKHDALGRFGVNLIHRDLELREGEVALELTDLDLRRQVVEPRPESEVVGAGNVIATQWVFGDKGEGVTCKQYCNYQDYAHTKGHATIT